MNFSFLPKMRMPKWTPGGLLTVQYEGTQYPSVWLLNPPGRERTLPFSIPEARSTFIYDYDQGAGGTIGISGSAVDSDGRLAGFVAWLSPNTGEVGIIRTGLYRPSMVTVGPDGTLWTVGKEIAAIALPPVPVPDASVIRHFDRSGKTLGSYVPQSTVKNPLLTLSGSTNTLRASHDRIAWFSVDGRYVEISLSGILLTDIKVDIPDAGKPIVEGISFALTDDGDAFLDVPYLVSPASGVTPLRQSWTFQLDRSERTWKPVQIAGSPPPSGVGHIYGVDGKRLVVQKRKGLRFYATGK
jgi:hypothetical protein